VVAGNFVSSFTLNFLSIFGHISSSIGPITLIWLSLKRYLPPAEVEYRRRPFWWSKGQGSSWAVTGGTGVSGLKCGYENFWSRVIFCKILLVTVDKLGEWQALGLVEHVTYIQLGTGLT